MSLILSGSDGLSDVDGSASTPAIRGTDTNTGIFFPAADTVATSTSGTERMRIDSSGNVGIGTSSPNAKLAVFQDVASPVTISIGNNSASTSAGTRLGFYYQGSLVGSILNQYDGVDFRTTYSSNGVSAFNTGGLERMRIDSSGNLLVGTTTNTGPARMMVSFVGSTSNGIGLIDTTDTSGTAYISFRNSAGTGVGSISRNGASNVSFNTSSDYRLKENISPMTGALATVQALNPVTYKWKSDGSDGQGFIAHELQAIVPDCVTGEKDAVDAEGNPQYQGIDTSFLVATLTAAIQEQQAIITDLKSRIEALEAK